VNAAPGARRAELADRPACPVRAANREDLAVTIAARRRPGKRQREEDR